MGPHKNPKLFEACGTNVGALDKEFTQRNLVSHTLRDLSELFKERETTESPVTEPALFAKLYALSSIQKTHLAVSGFTGMEPIDASRGYTEINAKAAEPHDQFHGKDPGNSPGAEQVLYETRLVQLIIPTFSTVEHIEVFGINIFRKDLDLTLGSGNGSREIDEEHEKYLAIIGKGGRVQDSSPQPVTGETVVIAVRNNQTQDAKLYTVNMVDPSSYADEVVMGPKEPINFKSDKVVVVTLPDSSRYEITCLEGEILSQAVNELSAGIDSLKKTPDPDSALSEEERIAARETFYSQSPTDE